MSDSSTVLVLAIALRDKCCTFPFRHYSCEKKIAERRRKRVEPAVLYVSHVKEISDCCDDTAFYWPRADRLQ